MNCLIPGGALMEVPARPNFSKGPASLAWMQPPAASALVAALDSKPSTTLTANSMLRTVVQQYLLYRWYQKGTCGIGLAAKPGSSNHESGLAIDVAEHATWQTALEAQGFSWLGSSDPVHFDFAGSGIVDLHGMDVLAFQQLWNINNPGDPIAEDGDYGPETEARLTSSPTDGFAVPPSCGGSAGAAGSAGSAGSAGAGAVAGAGGAGSGGVAGVAGQTSGGSAASNAESGCSCRAERRAPGGEWMLFGSALLFASFRRRRQRRRRLSRRGAGGLGERGAPGAAAGAPFPPSVAPPKRSRS
jgi:hypothetical protein